MHILLPLLLISCDDGKKLDALEQQIEEAEEDLRELKKKQRTSTRSSKKNISFDNLFQSASKPPPAKKSSRRSYPKKNPCDEATQDMIDTIDGILMQANSNPNSIDSRLEGLSDEFHRLGYNMGVECGAVGTANEAFSSVIIHISRTMSSYNSFTQEFAGGLLSGMCRVDTESTLQLTANALRICNRY